MYYGQEFKRQTALSQSQHRPGAGAGPRQTCQHVYIPNLVVDVSRKVPHARDADAEEKSTAGRVEGQHQAHQQRQDPAHPPRTRQASLPARSPPPPSTIPAPLPAREGLLAVPPGLPRVARQLRAGRFRRKIACARGKVRFELTITPSHTRTGPSSPEQQEPTQS